MCIRDRVLIGLLASRKRVGCLLDCPPDKLGFLLKDAAANPIMPEFTAGGDVPCQEEIHYASEEGFDIRKLLPAPQNTEEDVYKRQEYDSLLASLVASFTNVNTEIIFFSLILIAVLLFVLRRELALSLIHILLAVSMPILLALIETLQVFLS